MIIHFPSTEGRVSVPGGEVWYKLIHPDASGIPLVVMHGGPGSAHGYLLSLAALADERPVLFYDQLGCGFSDRPDDVSLWNAERFAEEFQVLRHALKLEEFHLFGHSWGAMLALDVY